MKRKLIRLMPGIPATALLGMMLATNCGSTNYTPNGTIPALDDHCNPPYVMTNLGGSEGCCSRDYPKTHVC
jgi:hypothetical protein